MLVLSLLAQAYNAFFAQTEAKNYQKISLKIAQTCLQRLRVFQLCDELLRSKKGGGQCLDLFNSMIHK